jgi:hypothetical protein
LNTQAQPEHPQRDKSSIQISSRGIKHCNRSRHFGVSLAASESVRFNLPAVLFYARLFWDRNDTVWFAFDEFCADQVDCPSAHAYGEKTKPSIKSDRCRRRIGARDIKPWEWARAKKREKLQQANQPP